MILCSHTIGELEFKFRPPPTSADVLDWLVWCQSAREEPQRFLDLTLGWACQWIYPKVDRHTLEAAMVNAGEPKEALHRLENLCNAIVNAASVPPGILDGIRLMLDRKNEVPDKWTPKPLCRCRKCLAGMELKPGQKCKRTGVHPLSQSLMNSALGVKDASAPYYLEQIRSVVDSADARRLRYQREDAEDRAESERIRNKNRESPTRH